MEACVFQEIVNFGVPSRPALNLTRVAILLTCCEGQANVSILI